MDCLTPMTNGACSSSIAIFKSSTILWISSSKNLITDSNVSFWLMAFVLLCFYVGDGFGSILFLFEYLEGFKNFPYDLVSLGISFISFSPSWPCFNCAFCSTLDFYSASFHRLHAWKLYATLSSFISSHDTLHFCTITHHFVCNFFFPCYLIIT